MIQSSRDKKTCKACISKIICQEDQMMLKDINLATYFQNSQIFLERENNDKEN